MSKHGSTSNPGQQLSAYLMDKSIESTERREDADFISRNFFPIIAEVNRSITAPSPLLWFQYFVLFIQLLFGSYFIFHQENTFPSEFITFCKVIFFGIVGDLDQTTFFFLFLFLIDLFSFIFLLIILVDYHNNHEFRTWQLNFLRIWHGHLFSYFIFPNMLFVTYSISSLYTKFKLSSITLFIGGLISITYTIVHVLFLSNLLNQSPFLFHSFSFHWRPPELFFTFIICTIPYAIDPLVPSSTSGFRYLPPILTIIVAPYIIFKIYYLPFNYLFSNVVWSSLSIAMITNSIFSILRNINDISINIYIYIFVPLGCLFLSWAIIWPLLNIRRKNIKNSLMYDTAFPEGVPNDENSEQLYLSTLNIKNKRQAFTYLQIGIEEGSDLFLDWSLSKYIYNNFEEHGDVLLFLTWTVSFFPSETSSMLRSFILSIPKEKKITLTNRAMLYQLHRLHIFRLSASTMEANSDLKLIQKMTNNCISNFSQIWKKLSVNELEVNPSLYQKLTETRRSTEAAWAEFLDKYPNDARFVSEYARFLLDCRCQFKESIHYQQRAKSIEKGTRVQNDRMFHRFVQKFPFYLKKGIVDTSGKLKKDLSNRNNQQQSQPPDYSVANAVQNDSSFEDSSDDIDIVEAEQYIPRAQLRIAFERAVSEINSIVIRKIIITEIITVLIAIVYSIIIAMKLVHMFDEKQELFNYLSYINKISRTYEMMTLKVTKMWSNYLYGNITKEDEINMFGPSITDLPNYYNIDSSDDQTVFNLSLRGLSYLDQFSNSLYHSDLNGDSILNMTRLISDTKIISAACIPQNNTMYRDDQYITIDFLWRSIFIHSSRLVINPEVVNLTDKSYLLCETYAKNLVLSEATKLITMNVSKSFSYEYQLLKRCNTSNFIDNEPGIPVPDNPRTCPDPPPIIGAPKDENVPSNVEKHSDDSILNFLIAFTPFLILALVYPATIFLSSALWTEKMEMTKRLQSFSKQECKDASEVIIKKTDEYKTENNSILPQEMKKSSIAIYVINVFCILSLISLLLVQLISGIYYSEDFDIIIEHSALFTSLCHAVVTSAHDTLLLMFLNDKENGNKVNFINLEFIETRIKESLNSICLISNMLRRGYYDVPSAQKFMNSIQVIMFNERCPINPDSKYPIDYYKCISFDQILSYFIGSINTMINSFDSYKTNSTESLLFWKLIDTRLSLGYLELSEIYEQKFRSIMHSFTLIVWICFAIIILFIFSSFGIELYSAAVSNGDLDTFKCLILHVDPVAFASNPQALSLIYGKKSLTDTKIISASHSVFYSSKDAMMSLNQDGVIESLNPAASNIFGYTPEQMLGQNIKLLINPEIKNNNQLFYTIQLMKSGQCSLIYESDFSGLRDDETILPLKVTLIGFSSNDRVAGSFAIICRDKTEEEKQRIEVEKAQKESEELLLQYVPQEMLSKLNKEEPEIGFSVQLSSLIMINIVQFTSYMSTLPPKEVLTNLGKIFNNFDKILSSIPTSTKIKVMGDIYFAASGLFITELLPSSHATDMVNFGLKTLESIEELNIQMNTSFQLRIGVHSGGPTTAGVFGPTKQIFDIIGPTVSACQKLEQKCVPGTINISNDTLSLLPPGRYHTEEHEILDLDGVPEQMTFILHPGHISASPTSNQMFTVPSIDALINGGTSGNSFSFDMIPPFTDDDGNNVNGSFRLPGLASLIDPQDQPQ